MLLWLVSSAIWAVSVNDMSFYSEPNRVFARLEVECASDEKPVVTTRASRAIARTPQNGDCTLPDKANLMMLDISLVFGFSNVLLWGAGLWFNLKECPQVLSSFASLAQVLHPAPPLPTPQIYVLVFTLERSSWTLASDALDAFRERRSSRGWQEPRRPPRPTATRPTTKTRTRSPVHSFRFNIRV